MTSKLFVRYSEAADEQAVFDFYQVNKHEFVFRRDPEVWRERISNGAVTVVEDEAGHIVAASIIYPIIIKDADGNDKHGWSEIGSVNVALKEAGIFTPMISALLMRAYFFEPPEDRFVTEILPDNTHSQHVFKKSGWQSYDIPEDLRNKAFETILPEDRDTSTLWFQMGAECMSDIARYIVDHINNPVVGKSKDGTVYEMDFSRCMIVTQFRIELDKVAQSTPDSNVNPSNAIKTHRNNLGL